MCFLTLWHQWRTISTNLFAFLRIEVASSFSLTQPLYLLFCLTSFRIFKASFISKYRENLKKINVLLIDKKVNNVSYSRNQLIEKYVYCHLYLVDEHRMNEGSVSYECHTQRENTAWIYWINPYHFMFHTALYRRIALTVHTIEITNSDVKFYSYT